MVAPARRTVFALFTAAALVAAAGVLAAPAPAPAPAGGGCVANPSAPIDDPPAFPTRYLGGCMTCSPDGSTCLECWRHFGLASNGTCVECPRNGPEEYQCLNCDGDEPSVCLECIENTEEAVVPGLYADEQGRCTKCAEGCATCQNLNGTCTACGSGLGLVDGECQPCSGKLGEGCENCDGDVSRCSKPAWGWSLDAAGQPFDCDLPNCEACASPTQCAACSYGYGLDAPGGKCVECRIKGCTECAASADSCTACRGGGYRRAAGGAACERCVHPGCTSCDAAADRCDYCSESEAAGKGPDPATGACVKCLDANCTHCPENAAYCWTCADGTRQDPRTGACVRCSAGCATCDVDQYSGREKCWSCQQGYELQEAVEQPHELSAIQLCAPKKR